MVSDIGVGDVVRHFKGKYYRIIGFGEHTETGEKEVLYQALYPPFGTWVRPYDMFMSEVDHEKYPDVEQRYRFEVMTITDLTNLASEIRNRGLRSQLSIYEDYAGDINLFCPSASKEEARCTNN